jgi:hypothetical protein
MEAMQALPWYVWPLLFLGGVLIGWIASRR